MPSEPEVKEVKDGTKEVDEIHIASSEYGLFEGIRDQYRIDCRDFYKKKRKS